MNPSQPEMRFPPTSPLPLEGSVPWQFPRNVACQPDSQMVSKFGERARPRVQGSAPSLNPFADVETSRRGRRLEHAGARALPGTG